MKIELLSLWLIASVHLAVCAESAEEQESKHWVVLVAGSSGWDNYRHQADVAHAYQVMRKHGIPPQNIITMMYDDVANHTYNPFPGKLFNDYQHNDVYHGLQVDYRGGEVSAGNFIDVLLDDQKLRDKGKKTLQSGPNDHVFIFFTDHGGYNVILFPKGELYADQLRDTLVKMHQQQRYQKMVIYIEACESGSMFDHVLPQNLSIFVTTASNPQEASWATFCNDKVIDTCLADEFSYQWIVDSQHHNTSQRTLQQQYTDVKSRVLHSHVMEYGDMSLSSDKLNEYQAYGPQLPFESKRQVKLAPSKDSRPAFQAHLVPLMRRVMNANSVEQSEAARQRLHRVLQLATLAKETVDQIVQTVQRDSSPTIQSPSIDQQISCLRQAYTQYKRGCFSIHQVPEVSQLLVKFRDLCKNGYDSAALVQAVQMVCD